MTVPPELIAASKKRLEAQAQEALANARKATAEAVFAENTAAASAYGLARETHKRNVELCSDEYHHVYYFPSEVTASSVTGCMRQLQTWQRLDAQEGVKSPIEIVFFSPGGSVWDGMALFDFVQAVRGSGHQVTTSAIGMAASMAGILLQAGDKRVMTRESWLMIHEASFQSGGKTTDVEDRVKLIQRVQARILDIFHDRATNCGAEKPITKAQIKRNWSRKDFWISSSEALKFGLIDEVR